MLLALELPRLLISSTMLTAVGVVYLLVGVCLADKTLDLENGVIVHMFEWPYSEIARECEEFLGPRGFAGVQLSPSTEHIVAEGQWWERYQVVSYHLVSRSGDEEHLRNMITRCNRAGVWVFADVVFNHMTADRDNCRGFGGTMCYPRDKSYPGVPYSSKDFHDRYCNPIDYKDAGQVRECELDGLHDLNQALESVRKPIVELLNKLIEFGVAGFRIDAAKHMHPDDLKIIYERLNYLNTKHGFEEKTKPLIYQEVIDKDGQEGVHYQDYTPYGLVTDLRVGKELRSCFHKNEKGENNLLTYLKTFDTDWSLVPKEKSVVFIENHDTEREHNDKGELTNTLTYRHSRAYKMAVMFMLAINDYTPKILSSYKFDNFDQGPPTLPPSPSRENLCYNGWLCQHRWRQIYNGVEFHNVVRGTTRRWWDNGKNQIAFCRGDKGFVAFNFEDYDMKQTIQTCLPKGEYCDIISGSVTPTGCSGNIIKVNENGEAEIKISKFDPYNSADDGVVAIHVDSVVKRNGVVIESGGGN